MPGVTGFVRIVELSLSSVSRPSLSLVVHSILRTSEKSWGTSKVGPRTSKVSDSLSSGPVEPAIVTGPQDQ